MLSYLDIISSGPGVHFYLGRMQLEDRHFYLGGIIQSYLFLFQHSPPQASMTGLSDMLRWDGLIPPSFQASHQCLIPPSPAGCAADLRTGINYIPEEYVTRH